MSFNLKYYSVPIVVDFNETIEQILKRWQGEREEAWKQVTEFMEKELFGKLYNA